MPVDISGLRTELLSDPWGIGYAGPISRGEDHTLASLLNRAITGASGVVFRGVIPAYEIVNNTLPADWAALTAAEKQRYQVIIGAGQVDVSNTNIRNAFVSMFSGSATFTSLLAMAKRQGSRADLLFSGNVSINEISIALRGGG